MTTTISQTLILTATTTRANELQKKYNDKYNFLKVVTLDHLILELFEIYDDSSILLDDNIATTIIYKLIQNGKSDYFKYLDKNAQSLKIIYDFFLKLQLNDIKIEDFQYPKDKQKALKELFSSYKKYLKLNNLVDSSGVVNIALKNINQYLKKFDEVLVDSFKVDSIDLIKSNKHKELLDKIKKYKLSKSIRRILKSDEPNLYQNRAFNSYDEVRTAIKIAKKLMLDGNSEDDIIIVCSDINEYLPYYYNLLDEYGMKGYDTVGLPLNSYSSNENSLKNHSNFKIQKAYWKYKEQYEKLVSLSNHFNLPIDKENLKTTLLQNSMVRGDKIGILFTDPNKFIGTQKRYQHIIFIGSDITHFPPKVKDNFLFTQKEAYELFCVNNVYEASKTLYNELKKLSDNLYVVTATYSGKRVLSQSLLIDKDINNEFNILDIKSKNDIFKEQKRVTKELDKYQQSITDTDFTVFDGILDQEFQEGNKLSASAINSYIKCPMQYYFSNVLKLNNPQDEQDGFDAAQKGKLMHLCFELFVNKIKDKNITTTDTKTLYDLMLDISQEAFNHDDTKKDIGYDKDGKLKLNINHKIDLQILQKGLYDIDISDKSELAKFVDYYIENGFDGFKNSSAEELFMLDSKFETIDLKNKSKDEIENISSSTRFIKGFIDRLDLLNNGEVNIIDYKSSVKSYNKKDFMLDEIDYLKNVQLGIYMLYAKQEYKDKSYDAYLLSFKDDEPNDKIKINDTICDDVYETMLKKQILQIKDDINSGKFEFNNSDKKVCEYCNFKYICHQEVLNKYSPI